MSILEVIACIMEVEQLRKKAANESAAKDQETKTATKADDAKSSAESSEKRFVMIKKIADGIYENCGSFRRRSEWTQSGSRRDCGQRRAAP